MISPKPLLDLIAMSESTDSRGQIRAFIDGYNVAVAYGPNTKDGRPHEPKVEVWNRGDIGGLPDGVYPGPGWWHQLNDATRQWLLGLNWRVMDPKHPLILLAEAADEDV